MECAESSKLSARPKTPPRPQGNVSPRTSPAGSRPPVPKKPPIAHVKPFSPRGKASPQTPPSTHSSPSQGGGTNKVPPPLPKNPPKGGETDVLVRQSESPDVVKKGSPVPNGSVPRCSSREDVDEQDAVEETIVTNDEANDSQNSTKSSPRDKDDSSLSKSSGSSDFGNLSINAAHSFFDEVMSAIGSKPEEPVKETETNTNDIQSVKTPSESFPEQDDSHCTPPLDEKGDNHQYQNSSENHAKSESEKKPMFLSPGANRPKPKKRLSLTNSGENAMSVTPNSIDIDAPQKQSIKSDNRPMLKPKPVPRKRLPMPNLSGIHSTSDKVSSTEISSENISSSTPLYEPSPNPMPLIPSKLKARCKGRLSLDTFFPRPVLAEMNQSNVSLNSSFSVGDVSDNEDTPRRPPRPRRMKTLQGKLNHSQDLSPLLSVGSQSDSLNCSKPGEDPNNTEDTSVLDSPSSNRKAPQKPKRKAMHARVNRSFSDVSSAVGYVAHVESQQAAKECFENGEKVHSPISKTQSEDLESRSRSKTTSEVDVPNCSITEGNTYTSWSQRFNPFDKCTSPIEDRPDFHSETCQNTPHRLVTSAKRPADVLSPIMPDKNNKLPSVKLKPYRKAPSPPLKPADLTKLNELNNNNNKSEDTKPELNLTPIENDYTYEVPIASPRSDRDEHVSQSNLPEHDGDRPSVGENSESAPSLPPRISIPKTPLDVSPPCPPPRCSKSGERVEDDDGYIYPEEVPVKFAESSYWSMSKSTRPHSAHVGQSELSKVQYNDLTGSPRTVAKLKHLSLMSEGSSHSDHSSDSQNRSSSYLLGHSSSEDSVTGNGRPGPKREKIYYIVEEIVNSEKIFVDVLKLMNVDFRLAVSAATEREGKSIIASDTLNRILDFLPQLQHFNEELLKDFTQRLNNWDEEKKVADIFVKKGPFLKLYTSYIQNFEAMTDLLQRSCEKNPAFAAVVRDFERSIVQTDLFSKKTHTMSGSIRPNMSPRCASLALRHYMLKPIQRIPQYKLLLQDYKKHLAPDSPDIKDTEIALSIVSEVANHANESMRYGDTVQKMLSIQHSLIGQFEVIKPGRTLMKQGELLKLSRKEMQPRMFFLFSDVLLYTTPVAGGYKLNNVLSLTSMKVRTEKQEEYKNEFSIISVQRSFTLATRTAEEKSDWMSALQSAIDENAHKRSTFDFGRIKSQPDLSRDFTLGSKAPVWIPDSRVTMCMLCTGEFTVTWRRHHCRACGKVVCGSCSENRAPLQYLDYKINRVCDECFENLQDDIEERSKSLGRGESLEQPEESGLSIAGIKARFLRIRRSARTFRGSGPKKRPAVLKEVKANDQGSTMSGYLKQHKGKKWRKLWFVLKDKVLYTYKASEDRAAIESYPLLGYEVVRISQYYEGVEPGLVFQCKHKNTEPLVFRTDSTTATQRWVELMRQASVP